MRSFEIVLGPKTDRWLVRTVAGLLIGNGLVQVGSPDTADGLAQARRLGLGTALTLATIDLVYVPSGRISRVYLIDAALEVAWIVAWSIEGWPPPSARLTPELRCSATRAQAAFRQLSRRYAATDG